MGLNILTGKSQMKIMCFGQYYDMNLFAKTLVLHNFGLARLCRH